MRNDLKELISAARQYTNLSEAVIEKDYHVTRAISVLLSLKNDYFQLIFTGGTCLAKAHKIVNRMSEDIDFKLHSTIELSSISRTRLNKELKVFREEIESTLIKEKFNLDRTRNIIRNEGRYLGLYLDYQTFFAKNNTLRPQLKIELTLSQAYLPTHNFSINTLIQDFLGDKVSLESCSLPCISLNETLAEKWVSLTRQVAAIDRKRQEQDDFLIRHLYDITVAHQANKINEDFYAVAKNAVHHDADQFKTQHLEYFENPIQEINHSLNILETNSCWQKCYEDFVDDMVFDESVSFEYESTIDVLKKISNMVIVGLGG